jgi:hypothetical protein
MCGADAPASARTAMVGEGCKANNTIQNKMIPIREMLAHAVKDGLEWLPP